MNFWKTVLAVFVGILLFEVVDNLVAAYCSQPYNCTFAK